MTGELGLRARRVANQVRERLTTLMTREVSDPALANVVITGVELPDDLSVAHVKARLLVGGDDPAKRKATMASLGRAASRLRRGLGSSLRLRRVPEIRFVYDTGVDAASRVETLLAEIDAESKQR
jgi:ribosome-binding factor A